MPSRGDVPRAETDKCKGRWLPPPEWFGQAEDRDGLLASRGAEVVATLTSHLDAALLDRLRALRLIVVPGAGYEHVDVAAARARGIQVANAGNVHSGDVAEHAVALALASLHRLPEMQAWVRQGHWQPTSHVGRRPSGCYTVATSARRKAERSECFPSVPVVPCRVRHPWSKPGTADEKKPSRPVTLFSIAAMGPLLAILGRPITTSRRSASGRGPGSAPNKPPPQAGCGCTGATREAGDAERVGARRGAGLLQG